MKQIHIKNKLENIGIDVNGLVLGDFDYIGEYTAKRQRSPQSPEYKTAGAFYRSNYERGILIYSLIRKFNLTSMIEIGFGRGYGTFCAAKAFYDAGIEGKIVTIDPALDEKFIQALQHVFPQDWFKYISFVKSTSIDALPKITEHFDLAYIDGDHSYQATKMDWEMCKDKTPKFVLMDDYHLPSKNDPGIQCRMAIDEINYEIDGYDEPELIIMDRRIMIDERKLLDELVDYGQVLFSKKDLIVDDLW